MQTLGPKTCILSLIAIVDPDTTPQSSMEGVWISTGVDHYLQTLEKINAQIYKCGFAHLVGSMLMQFLPGLVLSVHGLLHQQRSFSSLTRHSIFILL